MGSAALLTLLWLPGEALAACDPNPAISNAVATCTGTTINQGPGANYGYGNNGLTNLNVTVVTGATVTGTNYGIVFDDGTVTNSGAISGGQAGIIAATQTVTNSGAISGGLYGVIAQNATVTNSGTISGGLYGILAASTGNVTNSGTIIGTSGTAIQFGGTGNTLTIAPSSVITGNVTGGNTFQLGGIGTGTFDVSTIGAGQQYQGFNVFNKVDLSTWTVTGTSTFTGATTLNAGTLFVNGNLTSSSGVTVNNAGTLGGIGTVGNTTVSGGGTLAPGPAGAPGSMTVNGNLAFQAGAFYLVQVNPSSASSTNVIGTATLTGATVQTVPLAGSFTSRTYTILSATGGFGGTTFAGLTVVGSFPATVLNPHLIYDTNNVFLVLDPGTITLPPGTSGNQANVAGGINSAVLGGATPPAGFNILLNLSGAALTDALSQLSGETMTGNQQASFLSMNLFLNAMLDPFVVGRNGAFGAGLGYAPETSSRVRVAAQDAFAAALPVKAPSLQPSFEQRWRVWGAAYGGRNRTNGDAIVGSNDLSANAAGFAAGADYRVSHETVIGLATAIGETRWSVASLGNGRADAAQFGGYASTRWNSLYLSAAAAGAFYRAATDRTLNIAGTDRLEADFNAHSVGSRVEAGRRWQVAAFGFTPYVAVQVQSLRTPNYSERATTGSNQFALSYSSQTVTDTRSELGAWFDTHNFLVNGTPIVLRTRAAWVHDYNPGSRIGAAFQTLPGASFTVDGATAPRNSALTSAVAEMRLPSGVSLIGKFDGEFARGFRTIAGTATARYVW